ncbi:MAG: DNA polymerase III subunit alpha [Rhodothermales bacterium]
MHTCDFSHLHCHSQYSLLDGAAQIKTMVAKAAEHGQAALAITDHGNLYGVPEFFTAAKKAGVQPILGCEFYITPSGMQDRSDKVRYHQILLAKNAQGYQNLIKLSSLSYSEGYYYKPRIDLDLLKRLSSGLIATTCCLQGEVLQTILNKGEEAGRVAFERYLEIFGEDYYVEIQDHGIPEQHRCNEVLLRWASEYNVKIIATNDVHYVEQVDAEAQDVLLCLQTGKDLHDPNRMRFENNQFFLKSTDEMLGSLKGLTPIQRESALNNTRDIVDKCHFDLPMGTLLMPHYPIPESYGNDMDAYLKHLVFERAVERYHPLSQDVVDRLNYELGVIKTMGYAGYFLIVQDFTTAARTLGVSVGPGRGSAAGSAVAYCLGITNIDPLAYDLLFERFLNPERVSMPDIDIDFDDRGRGLVIDYVVQKYGRENVCQIITFGTMGARSVIRDVSRVLGIPLSEADRIAKMIPEGPKVDLDLALSTVPEFKQLLKDPNPQIRNLMHYATVLEGSARHTGVHAAGVIIAPGDVSDYVPVSVAKSKGDEVVTTQYDGKWIEAFGLLKMDFLGLKTLTIINDALSLIRENRGVEIDVDALPLDDTATYDMFKRGDTVAIFQFESEGMREWMRKLKPTCIDDLIAMNALYRPGPMDLIPNYVDRKHGRETVVYPHPVLEEILRPTYGIPIYQEQVMQMAQEMAGYSLGQADILRRAMGKKKQSEMDTQRQIFVEGSAQKGIDAVKANEVFDMMAKFAGYGFNKSHSAAYSLVAYHTAYLKANYTPEFLAAAMTNEMGDTKKLAVLLEEARRLNIDLLPPSINRSQAHFTVENGKIRIGMGAIKGAGIAAIEAIVASRDPEHPYTTIFQLVKKLDLRVVGKKTLESLAEAGAMEEFEGHRAQLVESVGPAMKYAQKIQADLAAGQSSLFGDASSNAFTMEPNLPIVEAWPRSRALKAERELIGFYVSGHPLEEFAAEARAFSTAKLGDVEALEQQAARAQGSGDGAPSYGGGGDPFRAQAPVHRFCGIITDIQRRVTKTGKPIVFATLEDFTGQGEITCFSSEFDRFQQYLKVDEIVLVRGNTDVRGGSVKIKVQDIVPMWKVRDQYIQGIVLRVDATSTELGDIEALRDLCDANRGKCKLYFDIFAPELPGGKQRVHSRKYVVEPTPELMNGLSRLFGRDNVVLESDAF